jgi:predicted dehydrogenase
MGRHHARVYAEMDNVELVGVVDANPETAKAIAEIKKLMVARKG